MKKLLPFLIILLLLSSVVNAHQTIDDFEDSSFNTTRWLRCGDSAPIVEADGKLTIECDTGEGSAANFCGIGGKEAAGTYGVGDTTQWVVSMETTGDITTAGWHDGSDNNCGHQAGFYYRAYATFSLDGLIWINFYDTDSYTTNDYGSYVAGEEYTVRTNYTSGTSINVSVYNSSGARVASEVSDGTINFGSVALTPMFNQHTTVQGDSYAYIVEEYNGSTPSPPTSAITTYTIDVTNFYNDTDLNGVVATFGTGCTNTTVAGIATVTNNSAGCSAIYGASALLVNLSLNGYFFNDTSFSVLANGTTNAGGYEGYVNITSITRLIDSAVLGAGLDTWTVNTTEKNYAECSGTYPCLIYLTNGSNLLTLQSTGYYDVSFNISITSPETTTATINSVYDAITTVYASNAYTGSSIQNFSINVSNTTNAYSAIYATTSGSVEIPSIFGAGGIGLFFLADAEGYALANTTFLPNNSTPYYNFSLWSNNSIRINIFDEDTGAPIYSNVTVIVTGNSTEKTYYTTSSTLFVVNLTDGNYTVKLQASNYTLKSYVVTVADRSSQILNAYLSASTDTVIFTARDALTSSSVEGVSIGMYRIINASLALVESKSTDITGRAQFTYSNGVRYSFIFSKTEYVTKTFSLDPIIFSSYDVPISPITTEFYDYNDVGTYYNPHTFQNDFNNSFTFAINSPAGILTAYSVNVSWKNGTWGASGTNANGGSFSTYINITGASILDTVNVTYTYFTVFGHEKTFSTLNGITGGTTNTIIGNQNNTYGMSLFERIFFATLIIIIFAGLATMFTNSTFGLFVGTVIMGIMSYLAFIPWLMTLITILVALVIMWKKGGVA